MHLFSYVITDRIMFVKSLPRKSNQNSCIYTFHIKTLSVHKINFLNLEIIFDVLNAGEECEPYFIIILVLFLLKL